MRKFNTISPRIWNSKRFMEATADERLLHLYLLTCPHQTLVGVFRLPLGDIASTLAWNRPRLAKALGGLCERDLIRHDHTTGEVMVLRWCRHSLHNKNCFIGAARILQDEIESVELQAAVRAEIESIRAGTLAATPAPGSVSTALLDKLKGNNTL